MPRLHFVMLYTLTIIILEGRGANVSRLELLYKHLTKSEVDCELQEVKDKQHLFDRVLVSYSERAEEKERKAA